MTDEVWVVFGVLLGIPATGLIVSLFVSSRIAPLVFLQKMKLNRTHYWAEYVTAGDADRLEITGYHLDTKIEKKIRVKINYWASFPLIEDDVIFGGRLILRKCSRIREERHEKIDRAKWLESCKETNRIYRELE